MIKHEGMLLFVYDNFGTPVALLIAKHLQKLVSAHAVIFAIDPHPDEFLEVHRARWLSK